MFAVERTVHNKYYCQEYQGSILLMHFYQLNATCFVLNSLLKDRNRLPVHSEHTGSHLALLVLKNLFVRICTDYMSMRTL